MRVNTVLLPVKEKRFNPLTQREEFMPTGMLQEYAAGKPVGQPIKAPSMAPVPQDRVTPSSMLRGQENVHSVTMYSPDARPLAAHHARSGESTAAAADRLADAASRFQVKGNRATAIPDFLTGGH
jgi:hypothetical protein